MSLFCFVTKCQASAEMEQSDLCKAMRKHTSHLLGQKCVEKSVDLHVLRPSFVGQEE